MRPLDHLADAPCYWAVKDDGAPYRCSDCGEYDSANKFYYCLTPNGKGHMVHRECIDEDWLRNAKQMPGQL